MFKTCLLMPKMYFLHCLTFPDASLTFLSPDGTLVLPLLISAGGAADEILVEALVFPAGLTLFPSLLTLDGARVLLCLSADFDTADVSGVMIDALEGRSLVVEDSRVGVDRESRGLGAGAGAALRIRLIALLKMKKKPMSKLLLSVYGVFYNEQTTTSIVWK